MTYKQALHLCKQRRSTVDPIPAFCEQLKRYEQECRDLGYLTATDTHNDNDNTNSLGSSDRKQSTGLSAGHAETEIVGSTKRKVEAGGDGVNKKRMVGPSRPSQSIGPSIGPQIATKPSQKKAPIGPLRPPPVKQEDGKELNKRT
jgi:hypothetical protein